MTLLKKIADLEKTADQFGFRWETTDQIMAQIYSECAEVKEHLDQGLLHADKLELQNEIGDLLHATFSLCIFCKLDPEATLLKTTDKFERRLNAVKQLAEEQGFSSLEGQSFNELMSIWRKAKLMVG